MKRRLFLAMLAFNLALAPALAQTPASKDGATSTIVTKMLAFDKEKTGKLTKAMVVDPRLHRLFDMGDANKDGVVTKEELITLATKMEAEAGSSEGGPKKGPPPKKP